nr:LysM peptidoglycan-binding domain-containing protein [uncultured Cohaesibacter sp.]
MKSATPFVAIVCGVFIALVVGVAAFGDRIGLGDLSSSINNKISAITALVVPPKKEEPAAASVKTSAEKPQTETVGDAEKTQKKEVSEQEPTFDIVRVEPDGNTLVAGRASPGWTVELRNGNATLSTAVADVNGEWVMVLNDPLGQGVSDLSLSAQSKDGAEVVTSKSSVTVARSDKDTGELLVVETTPGQASKVLTSIANPASKDASSGEAKAASVQDPPAAAAAEKPIVSEQTEAAQSQAEMSKVADGAADQTGENLEKPAAAAQPETAETGVEAPIDVASLAKPSAEASEAGSSNVAVANVDQKPAEGAPVAAGQSVAIEAVEIEGDMLFVAGAAEPAGALLRLYIDNGEIANGRSGETGRFLFDNNVSLDVGSHTVRVDMLDSANGAVLTRAEVSFDKQSDAKLVVNAQGTLGDKFQHGVSASGVSGAVQTKKVIIRRGDNLWTIARRVYGAGIRYSTIYDTNNDQIRDPHWIYPGQVFELPKGQDGWDNNFDAVDSPGLSKVPEPSASAVSG